MNKSELLAELNMNFSSVHNEQLMETKPDGTNWYDVEVHQLCPGNGLKICHFQFYVINEGMAGETAYYKEGLSPNLESRKSYRREVEYLIEQKIDSGHILTGIIKEYNEDRKWAIVRVFQDVSGKAVEKFYFTYKKINQSNDFIEAVLR